MLLALVVAGASAAAALHRRRRRRGLSRLQRAVCECARVIDCTHVLAEDYGSRFATVCPFERRVLLAHGVGGSRRSKQLLVTNGGLGTHVDSPEHFIPRGRTVEALSAARELVAPCALLSVEAACARDRDHEIGVDALRAWEAAHGRLPPRCVVLARTGWGAKYADPAAYLGHEPAEPHPNYPGGCMHFPGFSAAAAAWLVRERPDFGGVGVDTLSPDPGRSVDMPVHYAVLGADKLIVENLDLAGVPEAGAVLVIAPLKARGAPEAPARVFALVEGRADAVSRIDRAR